MSMDDIEKIIDGMKTKEDFMAFMEVFVKDCATNIQSWENKTVPDYLEAMGRWVEDMEAYYKNNEISGVDLSSINWRVFADILLSAKYYE
jgi:hypothetical protein